jgi:HK97 family phage major capsid protein
MYMTRDLSAKLRAQGEQFRWRGENPVERYCDERAAAVRAAAEPPRIDDPEHRTLRRVLERNEDLARLMRDRAGRAVITLPIDNLLQRTTITSSTIAPLPAREPAITPEPRRQLRLRDLLATFPTATNAVEWVEVTAHDKVAAPVSETSNKPEGALTFEVKTAPVRTIATWIPASRQILEDFDGLTNFVQSSLIYALEEEVEDQILLGSGAGQNLHGLVTQASNFDTGLLGSSWNKPDVIARAIQQLSSADQPFSDFCVLNPVDFWDIRLAKDAKGVYIFGLPGETPQIPRLWNVSVVVTTAMPQGTFLVGSADPRVVQLRVRREVNVEISTEHADYFARNLVAVLAETRLALVVTRPGAFVKGNLTSSPA